MDAVAQIQRLGWEWLPNGLATDNGTHIGSGPGAIVSVVMDGRTWRAFVPLERIWVTFERELQKVGCPSSASVGATFSCVGFLGWVSSATKSVSRAASSLVPKAVRRAASSVVSAAKTAASRAYGAVTSVPVLGTVVKATTTLATLPVRATQQLIAGKRIDQIAVDQFKRTLGSVQQLAPYAQTVVSMVPGIGSGVAAGIGGALALAQGKPIDEALLIAAKSALPGGPLAQSAFSVAEGVMSGKSVDTIAVNSLPLPAAAKTALAQGLTAAKDLAAGKPINQVALDAAMRNLPPDVQRAVQVGVALGQARNMQRSAAAAAQGAADLAGNYSQGISAAQQYARGVRSPPVLAALERAQASRGALATIVKRAQGGHPQANNVINALRLGQRPPARPGGGLFGALNRRFA